LQDQRNRTPLHVAAENGHAKVVELLLKHHAEINVHDKYTGAELCFLIRGKDKGEGPGREGGQGRVDSGRCGGGGEGFTKVKIRRWLM
jgi:hypothetical protein